MRCGLFTFTEKVSQLWNDMDPYRQTGGRKNKDMDSWIALIHDGTTAGNVLCMLRIVRGHHTSI
jgi:hypothetical protein